MTSVRFHETRHYLQHQLREEMTNTEMTNRQKIHIKFSSLLVLWGVVVSVKFGCFSPSRFSHFHCNTMRKAIKAHKNLHTK